MLTARPKGTRSMAGKKLISKLLISNQRDVVVSHDHHLEGINRHCQVAILRSLQKLRRGENHERINNKTRGLRQETAATPSFALNV